MTDIVVTVANVERNASTLTYSAIAGETITAGAAIYISTAGLAWLCDASTGQTVALQFRGIALNGGVAGTPIRYAYEGPVEGLTLTGNVEAPLYLSNTPGLIGDAAGDVSVKVGRICMRDDGTKFLWVTVLPLTVWA